MPPLIHCVRHAQGEHNLSQENHVIRDPGLTDLGKDQCHQLRDRFPHHAQIELIASSPFRRTLYTALESLGPVFEKNPAAKVVAHPDLQETSDVPCDTGSEVETLKREFVDKGLPVDLGLLYEGWHDKSAGRYIPTNQAIKQRARAVRQWLKARPEKEIVVVSHGGFLHYFTEDWEDSSQYQGTGWTNTEYRTFEFCDELHRDDLEGYEIGDDNASIKETIESRHRRGKNGLHPTREQQKMLYKLGTQGWDQQGLQLSTAERESAKVPEGKEVGGTRI